jgi:glycine cleavage system H protein
MEIQDYNMPDELYYEENHYWVRVEGDNLVMGMDDFAQQLAGEIVYVQLPFEGKKLKKGKKFTQVESGKWLGKVFAPVNGELIESNEELESNTSSMKTAMVPVGCLSLSQPTWLKSTN